MYKVWKALSELNAVEEVALKESAKYQKAVDVENKANIALIIIIILVVLISIGSVVYCKVAKKCCFAEKDEVSAEGGESDKNLFKNEVKSKNSKKKNNKESLMPSFQVADEQA